MNESKKEIKEKIVYLGLGSNIEPTQNIITAINILKRNFKLSGLSRIWESASRDSIGPQFLNSVVEIKTNISLKNLKYKLREIESSMGRVRTKDKNAPRQIDIDILIYDNEVLDEDIWKQPHIAIPLAEVYPSLIHPESAFTLRDIAEELYVDYEIILREDVAENHMFPATIRSA